MRELFLIIIVVSLILVTGCITFEEQPSGITCVSPEKNINGRCCFDEDSNGVCDIDERECPPSCDDDNPCTNDFCSFDTNFECKHSEITPCCGNGECEANEDLANECPEDCVVVDMTGFYHRYSGPDYMEGNKFVFIHTGSNLTDKKPDFYLNITAQDNKLKNIRVTYNCTDSKTGHKIDSINVDRIEVVPGYPNFGYENEYSDDDYSIYTSFYSKDLLTNIEVDELAVGETVEFRIRVVKEDYKTRSEFTCDFDFYFLNPLKHVRKRLDISYI